MKSIRPTGYMNDGGMGWTNTLAMILAVVIILLQVPALKAHELRPAILDIGISEGQADELRLHLVFSAEAFLADIDMSAVSDTDDSRQAGVYDDLRALPPERLADRMRRAFPSLTEDFAVTLGGETAVVELVTVTVADEPDPGLARDTRLEMRTSLPGKAGPISVSWEASLGALLVRQTGPGSDPAYADYLAAGGTSAAFTLDLAAARSLASTIRTYVHSGIIHIVPAGLDHILFVIGLLAYGLSARSLVLQVTLFTAAHTLTLALASIGWIAFPGSIVEPLIALSIAWIGIENMLRKSDRLHAARAAVVFAFGLLHGLGFASVLSDFGLPGHAFIVGLLSFNVGVEIGQLMIVVPLFLVLRAMRLSGAGFTWGFRIPVSVLISAVGIFWFAERTGLI